MAKSSHFSGQPLYCQVIRKFVNVSPCPGYLKYLSMDEENEKGHSVEEN